MTRTCENCDFWIRDKYDIKKGKCHRYPPTVIVGDNIHPHISLFPDSRPTDWCGEYEPKEAQDDNAK